MVNLTGAEFKKFWKDDAYWQYGSLQPKNIIFTVNGIEYPDTDIDNVVDHLKDNDNIEMSFGAVLTDNNEVYKSNDDFVNEWLKEFNSVKYTFSCERNDLLEKFFEFCFKTHGVNFTKTGGSNP